MTAAWTKLRVKFVAVKIGSGKTPAGGADAYVPSGVMLLRSQNVHFDGLRLEDVVFIDEETDAQMASTRVQEQDVLLNITGASLGRCAVAPPGMARANVNQHVCIVRPRRERIDPRFLHMILQSPGVQSAIFASENGSSREGLTFEQVGNFELSLPSQGEQHAIVAFLHAEIERLDRLRGAKERVLDLLAEKRRALIAHAVTRGLDPQVQLRDSSIPWLGAVPAHWCVERAEWLFRERDERSESGQEDLLTVSHLTGVTPRSEKDVAMFEADTTEGYKVCLPGDLVINTLWAWMGAMGVAPIKGIVSPAYNVYQTGPLLLPAFVDALVRIPQFAQEVTRYSKGVWSSRLRLYPEGFFEVFFPVPPIREQEAIVAHIAREVAKIESLGAATTRTIALLKERRTALIAAAVTGRIGVTAERPRRDNEVGVA